MNRILHDAIMRKRILKLTADTMLLVDRHWQSALTLSLIAIYGFCKRIYF